jgi:hypothetical protein
MSVEHKYPGFQWAEPLEANGLRVERVKDELSITGLLPRYGIKDDPSDLIRQYELARKVHIGKKSSSKASPHIRFANADTDERLIAFVRAFGPVVASSIRWDQDDPRILTARQDLRELRNEQIIYCAALELLQELRKKRYSSDSAQCLIQEIADNIGDWQLQWEREKSQCKGEPTWKFPGPSIQRIQSFSVEVPDLVRRVRNLLPLPPELDARIVICELVNTFSAKVFPNPVEMHSSILYGVRPLLYAVLRREFLYPHGSEVCANTQCREFFEIKRSGERFCNSDCSRQQRQREYWEKRGKQLRKKRRKKRTK